MTFSSVQKVVNISSMKKVLFPAVLCIVIIDGIRYLDTGGQTCGRLLEGGTLVDSGFWQPAGCMLHSYKQEETASCLRSNRLAFMGDSRMRSLFYAFVNALSPSSKLTGKRHSDILFDENDLSVEFIWMPEFNDSATMVYKKWLEMDSEPRFIIQSMAAHTIKRTNGSERGLSEYQMNITNLLPLMQELTEKRDVNIYWMLQEGVVESNMYPTRRAITNSELAKYNDVVLSLLTDISGMSLYKNIDVMSSNVEVALQCETSHSEDGIHLSREALEIDKDLLINLFCNDVIKPIDGSCCQKPPPLTILQMISFALGVLSLLGFGLSKIFCRDKKVEKPDPEKASKQPEQAKNGVNPCREFLSAAARMFLILLYFYLCDRSDVFMKANKHYTHIRFFIPLLYISFLGVFCIDQTQHVSLLNRDQTDEWKGWMQLVILIYHVTGASTNIPIYMHIRLLVAMYLFMTGYGHFSYFWSKGDFSLRRVYSVVFRLNFLTVSLCIVMNRPYQFYYFVPLCTFWYLVLYLAMAMWPRAYILANQAPKQADGVTELDEACQNGTTLCSPVIVMSFKILALFVGVVLLFLSQSFFEALFSWWPTVRLFELSTGSVREWWFRCQLDRFAMLHGAVFCFAYLVLKRLSVMDDTKQGCLFSMRSSLILVTVSIGILLSYTFWALHCTSKQACNSVHSYASVLPITSFILIRNIPGYLRSGYSSFFAWFGRISLELFIGQYHIWLAADTKGILVLASPYWPSLNLLVTTVVFVCVAHEINALTGVFVKYAVGSVRDSTRSRVLRFLATFGALVAAMLINDFAGKPPSLSADAAR